MVVISLRFLSRGDDNDGIESTVCPDLYGISTADDSVNPAVCMR